ncbi:MAG: hypothetical protein QOI56_2067, partial [Actinomycetota bacterium]|nr:hypothetical protein [Actinomycetota bacterium]
MTDRAAAGAAGHPPLGGGTVVGTMTDEAPQEPSAETIAVATSRAPDEPSAVETPASMPGGPAAPQVGDSSSSSDLAAGAGAAVARPTDEGSSPLGSRGQPVPAEAPPDAPVEAPETAGAPPVAADVVSEDAAAVPPAVSGPVLFPLADEGPADSPPDPFDDDEDDLTWDAIAVALAAEPPMPGTHRAEVAPPPAGESPARTP